MVACRALCDLRDLIEATERISSIPVLQAEHPISHAAGGAHAMQKSKNKLQGLGHAVRLIAPQFVKPYVKSNKNDAADAETISEAVRRPTMRFVPIKNVEQASGASAASISPELGDVSYSTSEPDSGPTRRVRSRHASANLRGLQ